MTLTENFDVESLFSKRPQAATAFLVKRIIQTPLYPSLFSHHLHPSVQYYCVAGNILHPCCCVDLRRHQSEILHCDHLSFYEICVKSGPIYSGPWPPLCSLLNAFTIQSCSPSPGNSQLPTVPKVHALICSTFPYTTGFLRSPL